MSMSTKIDDLPGPDIIPQESKQQNNYIEKHNNQYEEVGQETNIKANIKKKVHFSNDVEYIDNNPETITDWLKSEINEENLTIVLLIYLAGLPTFDKQLLNLPYIKEYFSNEFILSIIKALLLLLIFIFSKKYVLPKLKL